MHQAGFDKQAEEIVFEIVDNMDFLTNGDKSNIQVIKPGHPLFETLKKKLRPQTAIADKLKDFLARHQ